MKYVKAVVLKGPKDLSVEDAPIPNMQGWALVKVELVGICGTDKAFYVGTYPLLKKPLIPGHEVVGIVVKGPKELVGRRVVSEINFPDGTCEYCRAGLYTHCPNRKTLGIDFDGGMAEYFVAPSIALHIFNGPPELGIFVEPLAAVLNSFSQFPIKPNNKVAVIGTGNLAQLTAQVVRHLGVSRVDAIIRRGSKKAELMSKYVDSLVEEPKDQYYDIVVEASGDPNALDLAVRMLSLGVSFI